MNQQCFKNKFVNSWIFTLYYSHACIFEASSSEVGGPHTSVVYVWLPVDRDKGNAKVGLIAVNSSSRTRSILVLHQETLTKAMKKK